MTYPPRIVALVVAGGTGVRVGGELPKQYQTRGGKALLRYAVEGLIAHPAIIAIQVVIHPDHDAHYRAAFADAAMRSVVPPPVGGRLGGGLPRSEVSNNSASLPASPQRGEEFQGALLPPIHGGALRADSVRAGLVALAALAPDYVLIHDAARPFLSGEVIDRLVAALGPDHAVVPALPVHDTVRRVSPPPNLPPEGGGNLGNLSAQAGGGNLVWSEVPRDGLMRIQTPQAFPFAALTAIMASGAAATDEAALWLAGGRALRYVAGDERLRKITTGEDMFWAKKQVPMRTAVGMGFDVHELMPSGQKHVIRLGGIDIECEHKLHGHSDADVVLHAIVDALLGALADGDIGQHFPPHDDHLKGADSAIFVAGVLEKLCARGGEIQHVDVTIMCEAPKIAPHRDSMRARVAELLEIPLAHVSIKATTTERLGFIGRGEGIAAQAAATVALPLDAA